jgi:flagellar hook-length control protein FliK
MSLPAIATPALLQQVADPAPSVPSVGTALPRQLEAQIAPSPLAVHADALPLAPGTSSLFVSGWTPASAPKAPAPLYFAISAGLSTTIGDMQRAGSPLVPPIAVAPSAVPEPTPMPAHWQVAPNVSVASAPAIVAASAVHAPSAAAALPLQGFDRRIEQAVSSSAGGIATPAPVAFAPVAETPTLDLGREGWPTDMIAHIEQLRDAADATDTRIRLSPDMLGSVDIDVRQDGDTLHVRFIAEQAQTRTLLQEAQPRLAEAAEARGLKLGGSSVDLGAQGQHRQPAAQPAVASKRTPSTTVASGQEPADDTRIA